MIPARIVTLASRLEVQSPDGVVTYRVFALNERAWAQRLVRDLATSRSHGGSRTPGAKSQFHTKDDYRKRKG